MIDATLLNAGCSTHPAPTKHNRTYRNEEGVFATSHSNFYFCTNFVTQSSSEWLLPTTMLLLREFCLYLEQKNIAKTQLQLCSVMGGTGTGIHASIIIIKPKLIKAGANNQENHR